MIAKVVLVASAVMFAMTGLASAKAHKPAKPKQFTTIAGKWTCTPTCLPGFTGAPVGVKRVGVGLYFINELGWVSRAANAATPGVYDLIDWGTSVKVTKKKRMITFLNGAVWTR